MGWSSWNYFGEAINETLLRQTADALVSTGLRDLGFRYVVNARYKDLCCCGL